MNPSAQLLALHESYCRFTGLDLRWGYNVEAIWYLWWKEGNTEADLERVIKYLQRLYANNPRVLAACLRLHRVIGDTLFFAEMLAESNKVVRVRDQHKAKESVLRATGRAPEEQPDAKSAGEILRQSAAFKEFCQLKEKL